MKMFLRVALVLLISLVATNVWANNEYEETKKMFIDAGISEMFENSYGYALFPTIGKAGFVVGGAYGTGRVFTQSEYIGDTSMTQATIGAQLGGSGFSQVIFFRDEPALNDFMTGNFEFGAEVHAVALTAAAGASANTSGNSVTASGGKNNANTSGHYIKGMATFTITKGGLMYEVSVGGQKFKFKKK